MAVIDADTKHTAKTTNIPMSLDDITILNSVSSKFTMIVSLSIY